jgi:hypothetical protein
MPVTHDPHSESNLAWGLMRVNFAPHFGKLALTDLQLTFAFFSFVDGHLVLSVCVSML